MLASFIILPIRARSARIKAANSGDALPPGLEPVSTVGSRISGSWSVRAIASYSAATIDGGVFAGTKMPCHETPSIYG
jgi:hypothetical protein